MGGGEVEEFGGTSLRVILTVSTFEHVTTKHQKTLIPLKTYFLQLYMLSNLTLNTNKMQGNEHAWVFRKETQRTIYSSMYLTYTVSHFLTLASNVHLPLYPTNHQFSYP